jgi:hypothetical protein
VSNAPSTATPTRKRHPVIIAGVVSSLAFAGIGLVLYRVVEWLRPPPIEGPPPELRAEPGLQQFVPSARRPLLALEKPRSDEEEAPAVPPEHPFAKTKITGRVYDLETNEGIVGAIVRIRPTFGVPKLGPPAGDGSVTYTTRSDGSYAMKGIPPGSFDLEVNATGYAPSKSGFKKFTALEDDDGFDVGLLRGGSIEGRVRLPDGKPVDGARVSASAAETFALGEGTTLATTNDAGMFVLDPVEARELRVMATHPKFGTKIVALPASEDPIREVEIVLDGARIVRGHVTDGRAPIARAHVVAGLQRIDERIVAVAAGEKRFGVNTDDEGAFEIAVPASTPSVLLAEAAGFEHGTLLLGDNGEGEDNVELVLQPAIEFAGRVVASNGQPAVRAQIGIMPLAGGRRVLEGSTDDQGRFRIDGVSKRGPYRVVIQHFEHPTFITTEQQVGVDHRYELEAQGRILGVIVDAISGGPVTRYQYAVAGPTRRSAGAVSISGSFEVDQLPAGNYSLSIDAEGYESAFVESITVSEGQTVEGVTVRLKPAGAIVGRVRGGSPGNVIVHAWDQESRLEAEAMVSEDGGFSIDDLPSGTYTLTAVAESTEGELRGEVQNVTVQSGSVTRGIEIALSPVPSPPG